MTEREHYDSIDLPFYRSEIAPVLPGHVLDFHAHVWSKKHWKQVPYDTQSPGARYMVVETEYPAQRLLSDARTILPDRVYQAVCFGMPTPAADIERTNTYVAEIGRQEAFFPLMLAGKGLAEQSAIEQTLREGGFYGYKVLLNWQGDDYGHLSVSDMLGAVEMEPADRYRLVVLLHVPRSDRLADPEIQSGVASLAREYPQAQIVLAHCGRCYLPDQMQKAVAGIRNLDNVYLDTSMVMDVAVLQILLEEIDSTRLLFATDFPVPAMRGRRVYAMDHWVDLVQGQNPPSGYRVQSDNFRATFMVYEIVLAIRRAAERVKLSEDRLTAIFHDNGMALLDKVERP